MKERKRKMAYEPVMSHEEYLEIVKQYKDYKKGTYRSMSLEEKINFFDGFHTDHVPMFDENGNDMPGTLPDYVDLMHEFIHHPEVFSLTDISKFLEMLDDDCYQPSFMDDTLKVIRSIIRFQGKAGAVYFLKHLPDVPQHGKKYGLHYSIHYLVADDSAFQYLKEAVSEVEPSVQALVIQSIKDLKSYTDETGLGRIRELEQIISHA